MEGRKIFDTFLAIDLPEGRHTITMEYEPEGLRQGAIITFASVLFVAAVAVWGQVQKKRREEKKPA